MYFDPQVRFLPGLNPANPGRLIDFTTEEFQAKLPDFRDSVEPYKWMGFDHKSKFNGTMFRLPLRTAEQATGSRLSRTARDAESTEALLMEFAQQSTEMLLFLKHVLNIKIYKWSPGQASPSLISCTQVLQPGDGLAAARGFMGSAACAGRAPGAVLTQDFHMKIQYQGPASSGGDAGVPPGSAAAAGAAGAGAAGASPAPGSTSEVTTWLVANQMGGPRADAVAAKPEVKQLKLQPWSGVAACVGRERGGAHSPAALAGRAYCFLPLPVITGLPVHVNGYFELSSNRRDIWLGDRDMIGQGKLRAEWNAALLGDVAAPCYARVLLAAVARSQQRMQDAPDLVREELDALYALWPQELPATSAWRSVAQGALGALARQGVLYAAPATSATQVDGSMPEGRLTAGKWVAPADAVVCSDAVDGSWPGLRRALIQEGVPVVLLPQAVCSVLQAAGILSEQQTLSPAVVRDTYRAAAVAQGCACASLGDQAVGIQLLKYVCSDLLLTAGKDGQGQQRAKGAAVGGYSAPGFAALVGLPLLPLASGDMGLFQAPPSREHTEMLKELQVFGFPAAECDAAVRFVQEHYPAVAARGTPAVKEQALQVLVDGTQLQGSSGEQPAQTIYFPTVLQRSVLAAAPGARTRMVAAAGVLGEAAAAILARPALKASTNVNDVQAEDMAELLALALPSEWAAQRSVQWETSKAGQPSAQWLQDVWAYLAAEVQDLRPFAEGLPIVPVLGERLVSLQAVPCSITVHLATADGPDVAVLQSLGLHVLDTAATGLQSLHADMHRFVFEGTPAGILGALYARACAAHISGSLSPAPCDVAPLPRSENTLVVKLQDSEQQDAITHLHDSVEALFASSSSSSSSDRVQLARLLASVDHSALPGHLALLLQCLSVFPTCSGLRVSEDGTPLLVVAFLAPLPFPPAAYSVLGGGEPADAGVAVQRGTQPMRAVQWPDSLDLFPDVFASLAVACCGLAPLAPASAMGSGTGQALQLLARAVCLPKPSPEQVMLEMLLPQLELASELQATAIGCCILQGLPSTAKQSTVDALSTARMVKRAAAGRKAVGSAASSIASVSELYDVRSEDLKALLPGNMFPAYTAPCLLTWGELQAAAASVAGEELAGAAAAGDEDRQLKEAPSTGGAVLQQPRQILNETALASLQRLRVRSVLGPEEVRHAVGSVGTLGDREYARRVFKYVSDHAVDLFGRWVGPAAVSGRDAIAFHGGDALTSAIARARELETRRIQEESRRAKQSSGLFSRMFSSTADEPLREVHIDERSLPEYKRAAEQLQRSTLSANALVKQLRTSAWIPVCTSAAEAHSAWLGTVGAAEGAGIPVQVVPWPVQPVLAFTAVEAEAGEAPKRIVRAKDMWSHSGCALVLQEGSTSASMLWLLGCSADSTPKHSPKQAASQLLLLSTACSGTSLSDAVVQTLHPVVVSLVKVLDAAVKESGQDSDAVIALRAQLAQGAWAWTQSAHGFVAPSSMACTQDFDCTPFLFALPGPLGFAADSLVALGIQRKLGARAFAELLLKLQKAQPATLTTREVDMAVFAISRVAEAVDDVQGLGRLLVDEGGCLRRAQQCVYNDYGGDKGAAGIDDVRASQSTEEPAFMIHAKVPNAAAKAVGGGSLTRRMLASHSELLPMGMESFGQSEDLTQRIRHITDMYPEGSSMVAEHVQNADDAGASVVKIILDAHTYGTETLFGDGLAKWQGPALMVFNDGVFSEGDFAAISRVGQAGKMDKVNSTGRFGLGFCGNYAVTDLPCIVSSDSLVMFDPHLRSVPGADAQQPGMRMRFAASTAQGGAAAGEGASSGQDAEATLGKLAEQYSDQLAPFVALGCNFNGPFQGTIFRFPLRNAETAASSKIKPNDPIAQDPKGALLRMCEAYRAVSEYVLMFTKSVQCVECSFVPPGQPGGPRPAEQTVFSVQVGGRSMESRHGVDVSAPPDWSVVPWKDSLELRAAADHAWTACGKFLKYGMLKPPPNSEPLSKTQAMEVVNATSPPDLPSTYQILTMAIEDHGPPASGDGRTKVAPKLKLHEYFVHTRLGAGNARKMAYTHRDTLKFVPGASVAVLLAVNGQHVCIQPTAPAAAISASAGSDDLFVDVTAQTALDGSSGAAGDTEAAGAPQTEQPPAEGTQLDVRFRGAEPDPTIMPQGDLALGFTVLSNGRAFCTLPLPASTGLPVLVSAGFELASDRRNLRHGTDMEGVARIKAQWNNSLLQDIVAPSYCRLLLQMRDSLDGTQYGLVDTQRLVAEARSLLAVGGGTTRVSEALVRPGVVGARALCSIGAVQDDSPALPSGRHLGTVGSLSAYYAMWPRSAAVQPFTHITSAAASAIFRLKLALFFAPAFAPGDADAASVLPLGSWVSAGRLEQDVLFLPMQPDDFRTLDRLMRVDQEDSLLEDAAYFKEQGMSRLVVEIWPALLRLQQPVVPVPVHVFSFLREHAPDSQQVHSVTPASVRDAFRGAAMPSASGKLSEDDLLLLQRCALFVCEDMPLAPEQQVGFSGDSAMQKHLAALVDSADSKLARVLLAADFCASSLAGCALRPGKDTAAEWVAIPAAAAAPDLGRVYVVEPSEASNPMWGSAAGSSTWSTAHQGTAGSMDAALRQLADLAAQARAVLYLESHAAQQQLAQWGLAGTLSARVETALRVVRLCAPQLQALQLSTAVCTLQVPLPPLVKSMCLLHHAAAVFADCFLHGTPAVWARVAGAAVPWVQSVPGAAAPPGPAQDSAHQPTKRWMQAMWKWLSARLRQCIPPSEVETAPQLVQDNVWRAFSNARLPVVPVHSMGFGPEGELKTSHSMVNPWATEAGAVVVFDPRGYSPSLVALLCSLGAYALDVVSMGCPTHAPAASEAWHSCQPAAVSVLALVETGAVYGRSAAQLLSLLLLCVKRRLPQELAGRADSLVEAALQHLQATDVDADSLHGALPNVDSVHPQLGALLASLHGLGQQGGGQHEAATHHEAWAELHCHMMAGLQAGIENDSPPQWSDGAVLTPLEVAWVACLPLWRSYGAFAQTQGKPFPQGCTGLQRLQRTNFMQSRLLPPRSAHPIVLDGRFLAAGGCFFAQGAAHALGNVSSLVIQAAAQAETHFMKHAGVFYVGMDVLVTAHLLPSVPAAAPVVQGATTWTIARAVHAKEVTSDTISTLSSMRWVVASNPSDADAPLLLEGGGGRAAASGIPPAKHAPVRLATPQELYLRSTSGSLEALLPSTCFPARRPLLPASALLSDFVLGGGHPDWLHDSFALLPEAAARKLDGGLVAAGVNQRLQAAGVLVAAQCMAAESAGMLSEGDAGAATGSDAHQPLSQITKYSDIPRQHRIGILQNRAMQLLQYIADSSNLAQLCQACQPPLAPGDFMRQLGDIAWMPAVKMASFATVVPSAGDSTHSPLRKPSQVRGEQEAALVPACFARLMQLAPPVPQELHKRNFPQIFALSVDAARGAAVPRALQHAWGWDRPAAPEMYAQQLLAVAGDWGQLSEDAQGTKLQAVLSTSLQLYGLLSLALGLEHSHAPFKALHRSAAAEFTALAGEEVASPRAQGEGDSEAAQRVQSDTLGGAAWVFVGADGGFMPAQRVAFTGMQAARPHLFQLPDELLQFKDMFKALGVNDVFSAGSLCASVAGLRQPVSAEDAAFCAVSLNTLHSGTQRQFHEQTIKDVAEVDTAVAAWRQAVAGAALVAPDMDGQLRPLGQLVVDDCPGLPEADKTSLMQALHVPHETLQSSHVSLLALGAVSMSGLLSVQTEGGVSAMQGLSAARDPLKGVGGGLHTAIPDLMELAVCMGSSSCHVTFKAHREGALDGQSPHFARAALRPHVSLAMGGTVVTREGMQCLSEKGSRGQFPQPGHVRLSTASASTKGLNAGSPGLLGALQLGDFCLVLSGSNLYCLNAHRVKSTDAAQPGELLCLDLSHPSAACLQPVLGAWVAQVCQQMHVEVHAVGALAFFIQGTCICVPLDTSSLAVLSSDQLTACLVSSCRVPAERIGFQLPPPTGAAPEVPTPGPSVDVMTKLWESTVHAVQHSVIGAPSLHASSLSVQADGAGAACCLKVQDMALDGEMHRDVLPPVEGVSRVMPRAAGGIVSGLFKRSSAAVGSTADAVHSTLTTVRIGRLGQGAAIDPVEICVQETWVSCTPRSGDAAGRIPSVRLLAPVDRKLVHVRGLGTQWPAPTPSAHNCRCDTAMGSLDVSRCCASCVLPAVCAREGSPVQGLVRGGRLWLRGLRTDLPSHLPVDVYLDGAVVRETRLLALPPVQGAADADAGAAAGKAASSGLGDSTAAPTPAAAEWNSLALKQQVPLLYPALVAAFTQVGRREEAAQTDALELWPHPGQPVAAADQVLVDAVSFNAVQYLANCAVWPRWRPGARMETALEEDRVDALQASQVASNASQALQFGQRCIVSKSLHITQDTPLALANYLSGWAPLVQLPARVLQQLTASDGALPNKGSDAAPGMDLQMISPKTVASSIERMVAQSRTSLYTSPLMAAFVLGYALASDSHALRSVRKVPHAQQWPFASDAFTIGATCLGGAPLLPLASGGMSPCGRSSRQGARIASMAQLMLCDKDYLHGLGSSSVDNAPLLGQVLHPGLLQEHSLQGLVGAPVPDAYKARWDALQQCHAREGFAREDVLWAQYSLTQAAGADAQRAHLGLALLRVADMVPHLKRVIPQQFHSGPVQPWSTASPPGDRAAASVVGGAAAAGAQLFPLWLRLFWKTVHFKEPNHKALGELCLVPLRTGHLMSCKYFECAAPEAREQPSAICALLQGEESLAALDFPTASQQTAAAFNLTSTTAGGGSAAGGDGLGGWMQQAGGAVLHSVFIPRGHRASTADAAAFARVQLKAMHDYGRMPGQQGLLGPGQAWASLAAPQRGQLLYSLQDSGCPLDDQLREFIQKLELFETIDRQFVSVHAQEAVTLGAETLQVDKAALSAFQAACGGQAAPPGTQTAFSNVLTATTGAALPASDAGGGEGGGAAAAEGASQRLQRATLGSEGSVFLVPKPNLTRIYGVLGVKPAELPSILCKHVLPAFQRLHAGQQAALAAAMCARWGDLGQHPELRAQLKRLQWIPSDASLIPPAAGDAVGQLDLSDAAAAYGTGQLTAPSDLLHPHHRLARRGIRPGHGVFPHPACCSAGWLAVLLGLGLSATMNAKHVLQALRLLQAEAQSGQAAGSTAGLQVTRGQAATAMDLLRAAWIAVRPGTDGVPPDTLRAQRAVFPASAEAQQNNTDASSTPLLLLESQQRAVADLCVVPCWRPGPLCRQLKAIDLEPRSEDTEGEEGDFVLLPYSGCIREAHRLLAWTQMGILPQECVPPTAACSRVELPESPPNSTIIEHLQALVAANEDEAWRDASLAHWCAPDPPLICLAGALQALSSSEQSLTEEQNRWIRGAAFVPVGASYVPLRRLFFRLPRAAAIAPLAFEVPRALGAHEEWLKGMGVQETPSAKQYSALLQEISSDSAGAALSPAELQGALCIAELLGAAAAAGAASGAASAAGEAAAEALDMRGFDTGDVCIPDMFATMHPARACHVNDMQWATPFLQARAVLIAHPQLGVHTALALGGTRLTSVVQETRTAGAVVAPSTHLPPPQQLTDVLRSAEFASAVVAAAAAGRYQDTSGKVPAALTHSQLQSHQSAVQEALVAVQLQLVQGVTSTLHVGESQVAECSALWTSGDSAQQLLVSTSHFGAGTMPAEATCRAAVQWLNNPKRLPAAVARLCTDGLNSDALNALCVFMGQALQSGTQQARSSFNETLQAFRLPSVQEGAAGGGDASASAVIQQQLLRGVPGEPLQAVDESLVTLQVTRRFTPGDVVAVSRALVQTQPASAAGGGAGKVYGRVTEVSAGGDGPITALSVDMGPLGMAQLRSDQVFVFAASKRSGAAVPAGAAATAPLPAAADKPPPAADKVLPPAVPGGAPQTQGAAEASEQDLLLQALAELRQLAGLGAAPAEADAVKAVAKHRAAAAAAEAEVTRLQERLGQATQAAAEAQGMVACGICQDAEVDHVLVPCGHTICGGCLQRIAQDKCPFCRKGLQHKVKMYHP